MKMPASIKSLPLLFGFLFTISCMGPNLFGPKATTSQASEDTDKVAKQFKVVPGKSVIYVYRDKSGFGMERVKANIFIDQKEIAGTLHNTFVRIEVEPGLHQVVSQTEAISAITIQAESGRLYFIRQQAKWGWFKFTSNLAVIPEGEGRSGVNLCRLVQFGASW